MFTKILTRIDQYDYDKFTYFLHNRSQNDPKMALYCYCSVRVRVIRILSEVTISIFNTRLIRSIL